MTEETKRTLNNIKENITTTGKKVFSPKHLKKGAGILVVLAIFGAGGKYFIHQNKVEAKTRAEEARTTLLQNMAAQNNITLKSTDEIKSTIAQALGADANQVTFQSVNLISPTFDKADKGEKEDKKENKYKHEDKHEKDKKEHSRDNDRYEKNDKKFYKQNDGFQETQKQAGVLDAKTQATPEPKSVPEGQAPIPQGATVPNVAPAALPPAPFAPKQAPMFYNVKCSKDQVNYKFLVNAQDGKILRSEVEASKFGFLGK